MGAISRVGLLADTHSNKNDGSDLPDSVLKAFAKVDLIVHLGDVGKKGIISRLSEVAPVWVPVGGGKGYGPPGETGAPAKVVNGKTTMGITFNLAQPDKKISVGDDDLGFEGDMAALLKKRFKEDVGVVAFGGTHRPFHKTYDGIVFVNPGSPNMPMPGSPGAVAVVDVAKAAATIIEL